MGPELWNGLMGLRGLEPRTTRISSGQSAGWRIRAPRSWVPMCAESARCAAALPSRLLSARG
jgi:hypothetical protein